MLQALFCKIVGGMAIISLFSWLIVKLVGSAQTKVIIVGAGKDGLPIILDTKYTGPLGLIT